MSGITKRRSAQRVSKMSGIVTALLSGCPKCPKLLYWVDRLAVRSCASVHRVRYLFPSLILARQ